MGYLNYTLDDFELRVGALVLDRRCTELTISTGISEPEDWLTWKGSFTVRKTRESGLTDSDLSDRAVWGTGQQPVQLWINGTKAATLRIEKYRYNPDTGTGEGTLFQILDLLAMDRPSEIVEEVSYSSGTSVLTVVRSLLIRAGRINGVQVVSGSEIILSDAPGLMALTKITAPLTTEDPLKDAQDLAGKFFCWLWVDKDEVIRIKQRPQSGNTPLLYRSPKQVERDPSAASDRNFASAHTIITGTNQYTQPYQEEPEETEEPTDEENLDEEGRPRKIVTSTFSLGYEIFPNDYFPSSTTLIESERKVIYYFYFDGDPAEIGVDDFLFDLEFGNSNVLGDVQRELYRIYLERDREVALANLAGRDPEPKVGEDTIAAMSIRLGLRGKVFENIPSFANLNKFALEYADITIETDKEKIEFQPRGVNDARSTFPQYMIMSKRERVTEGTIRQKLYRLTITDPRTGQPQEFEDLPDLEDPQPKPDFEIVTENLKGECKLTPLAYTEFLPRTSIRDIGFVPGQAVIDEYAQRFAHREKQREQAELFQMPIASEYLTSGLAPFPIAHIGDGSFVIEQPAIDIGIDRASLTFQGDRIGALLIPVPNLPDPKPIPYNTSLFIAVPRNVWGIVGEAIAPVQLIGRNGTAPYTFSGSLPSGLSLSSAGLISGTPTARVNTGATITVTDSASAIATVQVWFVIVAPQPASIEVSEVVEFDFVLEIDFNTDPSRPGGLFESELALAFDFTVDDGDTTGGGGGYA